VPGPPGSAPLKVLAGTTNGEKAPPVSHALVAELAKSVQLDPALPYISPSRASRVVRARAAAVDRGRTAYRDPTGDLAARNVDNRARR